MEIRNPNEDLWLSQVLKQVCGFMDSFVLKCSIELGIFDTIHKSRTKSVALSSLAAALSNSIPSISKEKLSRLLRYLVQMGLLKKQEVSGEREETEQEEVVLSLTELSEFLLIDGEKSLVSWALAIIDEGDMGCWHELSSFCSSEDGATMFEKIHGSSVWDLAGKNEEVNKLINEAMASDTRLVMPALIEGCRRVFEGVKRIVDVGGGTGMAMSAVAKAFPHVQCIVFDLPHVVASAPVLELPNVTMVGGDMFESVPSADAFLLKFMLHNWQDNDCVKILKKCKEAIVEEGGKVMIVDIVLNSKKDEIVSQSELSLDIDMMVTSGGRERTEEEWKSLINTAGFKGYEIIPIMAIQSVIVAYP